MNTKTPMGELIEALEGNRNALPDTGNFIGIRDGLLNAIAVAKSKLEKEKQMVINIVNHCYKIERQKGFVPDGESYYTQTFKTINHEVDKSNP